MTNKELEQLARELIDAKIKAGETVQMPWAVQELINSQGEIEGEGLDFYMLCARENVYRVVKKIVDRFDCSSDEGYENDQQILFAGFKHMRIAYTIERNKERILVPILQMTETERLNRADQLEKISAGNMEHAQEIRRFNESMRLTATMAV